MMTAQQALQRTIEHREIFFDEMLSLMRQIMAGEISPVMTAAILTGLRVKKETISEITAAATVMRELATRVVVNPPHDHFLDVVGTSCGALLPTGHAREEIDGIPVTLMDVAMPMMIARAADTPDADAHAATRPVRRMWAARFLVQVAEGGMFAFLLFWLRSLSPDFPENSAANVFSLVLVCAVPLSLVLGRWSDRHGRPILPLAGWGLLCAAVLWSGRFLSGLSVAAGSAGIEHIVGLRDGAADVI